jgi:branched-subunit amino acid aminotransferase/4-amino-4-deoxychorismate lyase
MQWVFLNGQIIESDRAAIPALDRGLLHAYGLYETMRSHNGRVFRLDAHYRRLSEGAAALDIPLPLTLDDLRAAIDALLERNGLPDARIRLTVTAGPAPESGEEHISSLLVAIPLTDYPPQLYERGMAAITSATRRNETSPLSRIKSLNYLDNLLARAEARRRGADRAIMLNTQGLVAEGCSSNLFLLQGERLITPSIDSGALPGITRAAVLELAQEAGIACLEGEVEPSMLGDASEAFLTGAIMGVMPLTRLDGRPLGSGQPGAMTIRVRRLYEQAVARETRE